MLIFRMFSSFGTVESHSRCYPWHCTFTEWCSRAVVRMMRCTCEFMTSGPVMWLFYWLLEWRYRGGARKSWETRISILYHYELWCLRVLCLSTCPCMAVHTLTNVFYWKVSSAWGEARVPICINEEAERKPHPPKRKKKKKRIDIHQ